MEKQRHQKRVVFSFVALISMMSLFFAMPSQQEQHKPTAPSPSSGEFSRDSNQPLNSRAGFVVADDEGSTSQPWSVEKEPVVSRYAMVSAKNEVARKGMKEITHFTVGGEVYPLRTYRMLAMPNDPQANQWWVTNPGLDTAWDIPAGSYQTTLAIIDTGFALEHEEFQGRWHQNTGEIGPASSEGSSLYNCSDRGISLNYSCNLVDDDVDGMVDNESGAAPYENTSQFNCTDRGLLLDKSCNRLDDDGNGYADDVSGWDMINQDNSVQAGELSPNGSGTTHGTMVAGVAAATGNNSKGIAGANWSTKILPLQALDDDGYGDTRTIGRAIHYAIDQGVDVINISLGTEFQDDYVRGAIEAASAAGILVVAASGNSGCDCVAYPARYPEVLAVGALDTSGTRASFSSWGENLDMTAPGTNYTVPSWSNANQTARYVSGIGGTSFSSPLVAGIAALAKSHQPTAQPLHLISALRETVNRADITSTGTHDPQYGFGKLAAAIFRTRMVTAKHEPQAYVFSPVSAGSKLTGSILEGDGTYETYDCNAPQEGLALYELNKSSGSIYSISEVEVRKALSTGYSLSNFAYVCLRQPHDTADNIRYINIFREFKNIFLKP